MLKEINRELQQSEVRFLYSYPLPPTPPSLLTFPFIFIFHLLHTPYSILTHRQTGFPTGCLELEFNRDWLSLSIEQLAKFPPFLPSFLADRTKGLGARAQN